MRADAASTCIISIVRLFTLRSAIDTHDPTWDNAPTSYWTIVELNCGILCACLPTLRPFFRRFFPPDHDEADSGKGTLSTIGEKSSRQKPRNPYTVSSTTDAGSSEELRGLYEESEYARHSGRISSLKTVVYGMRGKEESQERIIVTREIGRPGWLGKT